MKKQDKTLDIIIDAIKNGNFEYIKKAIDRTSCTGFYLKFNNRTTLCFDTNRGWFKKDALFLIHGNKNQYTQLECSKKKLSELKGLIHTHFNENGKYAIESINL